MTQQHLLPKFGSGKAGEAKGPAAAELAADGSAVPEAVWSAETPENEARPMNVAEARPAEGPIVAEPTRGESPSAEPAQAGSKDHPGAPAARLPSYLMRWVRTKNPFGPKAAALKGGPLQGELRLESITVVRNDLSETDLEVVPGTQAPEPPVAAAQPETSPEKTRLFWRRIATRLFGVRRS